jgi:hypothetical protein
MLKINTSEIYKGLLGMARDISFSKNWPSGKYQSWIYGLKF